jgi:hypothetical protein
MKLPLYREDLEEGIACGCQAPGCTHKDHGPLSAVYLHANCHPHAGVDVCYKQGSGQLEITCRTCHRLIVNVAVASACTTN